jgi:signal transduction histidine kinase
VVINLFSNALKFTDQGRVTASAKRVAGDDGPEGYGAIEVTVADTGVGISSENLLDVFEKFKQVGDTLTDRPKGTGLGLPICKQIVEHYGGVLRVESVPGVGSVFAFTLPLPPPELH